MELVKKATNYIIDNKNKVNQTYRSKYHMEPTVGWMNDPNGLIFVDGEFHLFYQSNVYDSRPSDMAWGHFISKDLVKYVETDIALYPDGKEKGETGCFSGSSFIENNEMKFVYTKHYEGETVEKNLETQFICKTKDKIHFIKDESPCIDENELPDYVSTTEIRDPQIFEFEGKCYLILGGRTTDHRGLIIVYSGKDSTSLHFDFIIGPFEETYCMVECPSFVTVDGKDVIVYSAYRNGPSNGVYYIIGEFRPEDKTFDILAKGELDFADAFYAPKLIENYEVPTILGWLENWNKKHVTLELNHHWVGSFSFPRVLSIKDNELYQNFHHVIYSYCVNEEKITSGDISRASLVSFAFKGDFSLVLEGLDGGLTLYSRDNFILLDTLKANNMTGMVFKSRKQYEQGNISFLLDTSSIEIFICEGRETISTRFYILGDKLHLSSQGLDEIIVKEIEVK